MEERRMTFVLSYLHQHPPAQPGVHQRLCHPAGGVGSRAVHLGVVFPRKSPPSVGPPTPISVHDDFPARHSCVPLEKKVKISERTEK